MVSYYEEQLEKSWKVNSRAWTESIRQEKIKSRIEVTNPAITNTILSYRPQSVLDIGCGEGWLARELSSQNINVVGIDGSKNLIDEANNLGSGAFHWMNYDQFADNPTKIGADFDVIVFNFSLLSEEIRPVLEACKKVLKKSGTIIIQTLHPVTVIQNNEERYEDGWRIEHFDGMGEGYEESMPWYFRTLSSWMKELHHAGLEILDINEPVDQTKAKPLSLILAATPKQS